jgi:hypothetical protein
MPLVQIEHRPTGVLNEGEKYQKVKEVKLMAHLVLSVVIGGATHRAPQN